MAGGVGDPGPVPATLLLERWFEESRLSPLTGNRRWCGIGVRPIAATKRRLRRLAEVCRMGALGLLQDLEQAQALHRRFGYDRFAR